MKLKWLIGAIAVLVPLSIAVIVGVLLSSRDPTPGELKACLREVRAKIVRSGDDLGPQVRSDVQAQAVRRVARSEVGDSTAVLLEGTRYRLLVLAGPESPSIEGDLARRLLERGGEYQVVAQETDPMRGALSECVEVIR